MAPNRSMRRKAVPKRSITQRRVSSNGLVTNAGHDLKMSPEEWKAARQKDWNKGLIQDSVARAEREHRAGGHGEIEVLCPDEEHVASTRLVGQTAIDIRKANYLVPIALVIDPQWPDGTGIRKELNQAQWEAMLDHGHFCFRCRHRQIVPFQPVCKSCGWTQELTRQAVEFLYEKNLATKAQGNITARRMREFDARHLRT